MSVIKDIGKVLGKVAPAIASAIPGGGLVASAARAVLTDVLGVGSSSSDEEIQAALAAANPELLLKLREADQQFERDMMQIAVDDTKDARAREVAMHGDWVTKALAMGVLVIWAGTHVFLLRWEPPGANMALVQHALGLLDTSIALVLGYYFGSSRGSKIKDVAGK